MGKELSVATTRFVMKTVDELAMPDEHGRTRHADDRDELLAQRAGEAPRDVLVAMFWATYEKARDEWMAREFKRRAEGS